MPPFGNLYDTPVYVDRGLGEQEEIIFNAGRIANWRAWHGRIRCGR